MSDIRYLLFDAANTLIHKPSLWTKMQAVLHQHEIDVDMKILQERHKLISEVLFFPDRTNSEFYKKFNGELLYSLGIIPNDGLLDDIFKACTYLDWEQFDDTVLLHTIGLPKGILSNFNVTLADKISQLLPSVFLTVITSEELACAKPTSDFYSKAINIIGVNPENILYIGDSIKLDMEPAQKLGLNVLLIDRMNCFPYFSNRIGSLRQIENFI